MVSHDSLQTASTSQDRSELVTRGACNRDDHGGCGGHGGRGGYGHGGARGKVLTEGRGHPTCYHCGEEGHVKGIVQKYMIDPYNMHMQVPLKIH